MAEQLTSDPWANVISRNGFSGDELISMLQKSIRRGNEKAALVAAYEMYITSPQFADKLWRRLLCISVEDVGFGNLHAPETIWSLYKMRRNFTYPVGDQPIFLVHAVRYLCRCVKDRSSDNIKSMLAMDFERGYVPEVPDYSYDMHTVKGREMGRGNAHFLSEASMVTPEMDEAWVRKLHDDYMRFCEIKNDDDKVEAFLNMQW